MEITILPPKNCNLRDIKHEIRQLKSGFVDISVYPNGFEMVVTHINGTSNVETSMPLIKIDDHTYQIPD